MNDILLQRRISTMYDLNYKRIGLILEWNYDMIIKYYNVDW